MHADQSQILALEGELDILRRENEDLISETEKLEKQIQEVKNLEQDARKIIALKVRKTRK